MNLRGVLKRDGQNCPAGARSGGIGHFERDGEGPVKWILAPLYSYEKGDLARRCKDPHSS